MTDWLQQYSSALEARDAHEQAHKPYIDACRCFHSDHAPPPQVDVRSDTALADRTAQAAANETLAGPASPSPSADRTSLPTRGKPGKEPELAAPDDLASLRTDLANTQKARASLQTQLQELTAQLTGLTTQQRASQAQTTVLTRQKAELERKLRDRDEELRGKSKMVEQAHDEMVAQGLQLNLAEDRSAKLEKENRELVDRWMKRMGEEAERVNRDSKWE